MLWRSSGEKKSDQILNKYNIYNEETNLALGPISL